ncbi:MAG: Holliday junction resolvase RuvX [Saccharofermentanales bacterium]
MPERKLGIDYGEKRIGVAVSDPLGYTARGIATIYWNGIDYDRAAEKVRLLCEEYSADTIVVGLPLRTDGKNSASGEKAIRFADEIRKKVSAEVIMKDERYTSVIANRILRETGGGKDRKSGAADQMAAEIILSDYLRYLKKDDEG